MRYLLIILLLFIGCDDDPVSLEPVYGCTNQSACNFNPNATIFDDTCIYEEEDCLGNCGGSAVVDGCGVCEGDGLSCEFTANITLTNNSIPIPNADVFIKYDCADVNDVIQSEACSNSLLRSSQAMQYDVPNTGLVRLYEYDLDNNLIRTLIDEVHAAGSYHFIYQPLEYFAPFNLSVVKIVLEHNDNTVENFSIFDTTPDFNASLNLGQTNESGEFILDSSYIKSYNLPTFYNIPGIQGADGQGNITNFYTFSEIYNNLHIYFLYDGVYKRFDIDLQNASYNYSFEWLEGEIFNAPTLNSNDYNQNYRDNENDLPTELNLHLYPNPFN